MPKRRLLVLQAPPDEGPARPPWQWSMFGAGLMVLSWLLLTVLSSPVVSFILRANVGSWASPDDLAVRLAAAPSDAIFRLNIENFALQVTVLAAAAMVSGLVLGIWGPGRPLAVAASAGAMVAVGGVVFAAVSARAAGEAVTVSIWGSVVLVPCAAAAASAGAWLGARRKRPLPP